MQRPIKPLKEQVKDLFAMHSSERRGSILMILLLLSIGTWAVMQQWFVEPVVADMEPLRIELQAWLATKDSAAIGTTELKEPFAFDPNSIDRAGWLALGFTGKQVDGIERYQNKGGRFRTKGDLGRMYTIKPEQFERLKPFILLPDSLQRRTYPERPKYEGGSRDTAAHKWPERKPYVDARPVFRKLDVNTADTVALVALPGIGPSFARGIVKYRESLGGYHSLDQLAEVYVLKDKPDAVLRLKELLLVDTLMVRRLAMNTCTVEELAAHPYARWKIAKPLIAYRAQHGPFKRVEDIKGCTLISEEVFRKLAPYLSVE